MESTTKAVEYFGLFLTELRNVGYAVPLSDSATAVLLKDAVDMLSPDDADAYVTNESLSAAMEHMAEMSATDNGANP
jgi:hypothetical protein